MSIVWKPQHPHTSNMWKFMRFVEQIHHENFDDYQQLYAWSIAQPALFWQTLCDFFNITFNTPATCVLKNPDSMIDATWFDGATFNFAEKLLSRRDDHPALISINENGQRDVLTYHQLYQQVAGCAEGLKIAGIKTGDNVVAILPNVPFTIIAMLATASIGAIWSSCSPDFGAKAAIDRLGQVTPKLLFMGDGHQYLGKQHDATDKIQAVIQALPSLTHVVICPIIHSNPPVENLSIACFWKEFVTSATECEFNARPFSHPLYILFSSGTTGKPKCIVHGAGGTLLQHIKELGLHTDIHENDNLCFYTTCGWMMWNWMVSILALGATLTLYEGAPTYPDAYQLFKLIDDEGITVFGTSAKFISSVEKTGVKPRERYALNQLRTLLSTGSPLLPPNYDFVYEHIKSDVQLSSISGGTDIISCFALGNPMLPVRRGELQCLGLGMAVDVFNEAGNSVKQERGELVCTQPFPSMPLFFWEDPERHAYQKAYFSRFDNIWAHGDFAEMTRHAGLIIYGRSDAILNPGGVRIGTAEIYRQVEKIPQVVDSIVISQDWEDDVRIILFVKLNAGCILDDTLEQLIRQTLRQNASPRHVPAKILQVADIPRTMSGKIVELAVRQVVHGQMVNNLQSLANPDALNEFKGRKELAF